VQADRGVEVDTNPYRVPWRRIGETVTVQATDDQVCMRHGGAEVARHPVVAGRRQRVIDPTPLAGVVGAPGWAPGARPAVETAPPPTPALWRPLAEYEARAGGGW
jgi:hypothetical protein